jgi:phage terminase Nu1 subunit (DNA packaging protein)
MVLFKKADSSTPTVSASELGEWLKLSPQAIAKYAASNVLVRVARGRYDLKASIANYCEVIRASASGRGSPVATERQRLVSAQADAAEHKAQQLAGKLLPAAEVESAWQAIVRTTRAALLALPSRCGAQIAQLTPHDIVVIDNEVKAVLQELSVTEILNEK